MEIWKDIPGYEGLYKISNKGRVKSCARIGYYNRDNSIIINYKEKILKPIVADNEYLKIILYKDRQSKRFKIHRLVANAFIPNPENKPEVNHKDEDRSNNNDWNLEWATRKENLDYSKKITKSAAVISVKKLRIIYKNNLNVTLDDFVNILIKESK